MYNAIAGSCAEQEANAGGGGGGGGGGGVAHVSIATTHSGNFNNAVKIAISNFGQTFNYSNGVKDGSNSTFGTASSPTRTTQIVPISASHYTSSANSASSQILIAGFIRDNNFISNNNYNWSVSSVSSSLSNGCSLSSLNVDDSDSTTQDNTALVAGVNFGIGTFGIYTNLFIASTSYPVFRINHASGRGASTHPAVGDTVTLRITASSEDTLGIIHTAIHDVTLEWT